MDTYFRPLTLAFEQHGNEVNALGAQQYMRNMFPFFGIKTPERRAIVKDFFRENSYPAHADLQRAVEWLYAQPQREYHYVAMEMPLHYRKSWTPDDLYTLEWLITHNSWWDTVDAVNKSAGYFFQRFPYLQEPVSTRWIESDNIWLQRIAIIHQLSYKDKTNLPLLFSQILRRADSKEFFVQKAIGWALRQYSKTDPAAVVDFIKSHDLPALSRREALKHCL